MISNPTPINARLMAVANSRYAGYCTPSTVIRVVTGAVTEPGVVPNQASNPWRITMPTPHMASSVANMPRRYSVRSRNRSVT